MSKHYGLAALGVTPGFVVEIDHAFDEPHDVWMNITARNWEFRFEITTESDAARMLAFLRENNGVLAFSELAVGTLHGMIVNLFKDDEFGDRFWLRAGGDGLVNFTIAGNDLTEFTEAIAQVVADLQS